MRLRSLAALSCLLTLGGCARPALPATALNPAATPRGEAPPAAPVATAPETAVVAPRSASSVASRGAAPSPASREDVVEAARQIAATSMPRDCSAFVISAYARAGRPLHTQAAKGGSLAEGMYQSLAREKRTFRDAPAPGDLAFFRDTFGPLRGRVTHVSLVERVEPDGTVVMLDRLNTGVKESLCCLHAPHDPARNSWLRRARGKEPSLAGELFVAFGRP